ncbi:unnamed protein product [Protopolystoma xenopodis]|uniref:Uncharacterized protein n=1 Tax=Protopolystoma xenopodis TaxID=117903 RepID=A0A3S5C1A9_9PLAT|nr:unnamed protein product [Protopolystoma xenopodis]
MQIVDTFPTDTSLLEVVPSTQEENLPTVEAMDLIASNPPSSISSIIPPLLAQPITGSVSDSSTRICGPENHKGQEHTTNEEKR